jgi:Fe-S-cluster containining protein
VFEVQGSLKQTAKMKPKRKIKKIDCVKCSQQHACCDFGAWVDLEEAKKILSLGLKGGDFFHLEKDDDYPSGYRVGTSVEDERCSFLTPEGLCAIHKVDYNLKPRHCKEFPYENGKLAPLADVLCSAVKFKKKSRKK